MNPILLKALELFIPLVMGILLVAWFFRGLFLTFFRVKYSRGKYLIVKVRDLIRPYYKIGYIDDGEWLVFKDKKKEQKRILIKSKSSIYRDLGVEWIEVDPEKNVLVEWGEIFKAVEGHDANKTDSLLTRALYKPSLVDQKLKIILIIVIIILIVCVLIGVLLFRVSKNSDLTLAELHIIRVMVSNASNVIVG